jgi:predicted transcriptional regulator
MSNLRALELAVEIVSAFVVTNKITANALPGLIGPVHEALKMPIAVSSLSAEKPTPTVAVGKSVSPDYIICLEDGRKFKSMRHHLKQLGMTPEQYRKKWELPFDYPMVAPNLAARRSELATKQKFGHWRTKPSSVEVKDREAARTRSRKTPSKQGPSGR